MWHASRWPRGIFPSWLAGDQLRKAKTPEALAAALDDAAPHENAMRESVQLARERLAQMKQPARCSCVGVCFGSALCLTMLFAAAMLWALALSSGRQGDAALSLAKNVDVGYGSYATSATYGFTCNETALTAEADHAYSSVVASAATVLRWTCRAMGALSLRLGNSGSTYAAAQLDTQQRSAALASDIGHSSHGVLSADSLPANSFDDVANGEPITSQQLNELEKSLQSVLEAQPECSWPSGEMWTCWVKWSGSNADADMLDKAEFLLYMQCRLRELPHACRGWFVSA